MKEVDITTVKKIFAKRLKYLRETERLSQEELASFLNISRTHVANLETAKSGLSIKLLYECSMFFNCTTDYLLGLTDFPHSQLPISNDVFELMRKFNEVKFDDYEITESDKEKIISAIKHAISIVKLSE